MSKSMHITIIFFLFLNLVTCRRRSNDDNTPTIDINFKTTFTDHQANLIKLPLTTIDNTDTAKTNFCQNATRGAAARITGSTEIWACAGAGIGVLLTTPLTNFPITKEFLGVFSFSDAKYTSQHTTANIFPPLYVMIYVVQSSDRVGFKTTTNAISVSSGEKIKWVTDYSGFSDIPVKNQYLTGDGGLVGIKFPDNNNFGFVEFRLDKDLVTSMKLQEL